MIYTVTFNPSLDYIVTVRDFEAGKLNRTVDELIFPGGKGINVSIVLKNLGYQSTALGFLAGFTGDRIRELLSGKGILSDFISVPEGQTRINVKVRSGKETEINGMGPKIGEVQMRELYEKLDGLSGSDILVLSGSIPAGMPETVYSEIMARLSDKKMNIAVDATQDLLLNVLPYHPFLIKPNNHELGEIFHVKIENQDDVVLYGRKLLERGARNVLVSMGGDGAVLITENGEAYRTAAPRGKLKNSIGAGDSVVAGFLAGYLKTGDCKEAFKLGVCTGSASAFSDELATKEEAEALLRGMKFDF